ncbi:MAG: hypothetical protein NZ828_02045 [Alphaproteobacteria bacterium]|nr:hypothetical protein [Alphaproteobacteria bacterium]
MEKEHGFLSMMFGATVAGKVLEQSVNMSTMIAPEDPVICGASLLLGSIVSGLAGYGSSYHLHKFLNSENVPQKQQNKLGS